MEKRRNGEKIFGFSAWPRLTFWAVEITLWKDLEDPAVALMARGSTEEVALRSIEFKAIFFTSTESESVRTSVAFRVLY